MNNKMVESKIEAEERGVTVEVVDHRCLSGPSNRPSQYPEIPGLLHKT